MKTGNFARLSVMMFLQFFVWGAWYVTAPNFLGSIGFGPADFGWTYSVGPIAGLLTPLFVGMIADRFFSAEKVLGVMHLTGAACMYFAATLMSADNPSPAMINWVFFGHMLAYYPTLALSNTVAMRNMTDPEKEFPYIRVFGTIGWIAAGLLLSVQGWGTQIEMFYLTAGAAAILGIFSFFLPPTPPETTGKLTVREIFGLDALVLLKDRNYLIFVVSSMLICIPLAFYYQIASRVVEMIDFSQVGFIQTVKDMMQMGDVIGATMALGQVSEIFFMLIMPFFFARLGVKKMLAIGMLAWVVRYALFSIGAADEVRWMVMIGILLHGICYDFFFVTGQIYTDQKAPQPIRAQAQGLLVMLTLGVGMLIGAQTAGFIEGQHTTDESKAFNKQVAAKADEIKAADEAGAPAEKIEELTVEKTALRKQELQAIEWKPLWAKPAAFAGIILVLFVLLFHEKGRVKSSDEDSENESPTEKTDSAQ